MHILWCVYIYILSTIYIYNYIMHVYIYKVYMYIHIYSVQYINIHTYNACIYIKCIYTYIYDIHIYTWNTMYKYTFLYAVIHMYIYMRKGCRMWYVRRNNDLHQNLLDWTPQSTVILTSFNCVLCVQSNKLLCCMLLQKLNCENAVWGGDTCSVL